MDGDNIVIVVEGGVVRNVYSDNANAQVIIVDLDEKKESDDYVSTLQWPDTQFDEEEIREVIGDNVKDFMN